MRVTIMIIGLLIGAAGFSQESVQKRKQADSYYDHYDFYKAIPLYNQLLQRNPKDISVYEKLASIYDHLNDSENSERCYAFLVKTKGAKAEYYLNYARALSHNGKYEAAGEWYVKYGQARPGDPRGAGFSAAYGRIKTFYSDSGSYKIRKAPFSSSSDDFSPAYYGGSIVFASDRGESSHGQKTYNWTQKPFLDLYVAGKDSVVVRPFSGELNSKYHEGPVTFGRGEDTIIFTRSNYLHSRPGAGSGGINRLGLFRAVWDKGQHKWTWITPLSMNSDVYSVEHPALSPDGMRLYFASDMKGGQGGFDLYVSDRVRGADGKQSWGTPRNLGPGINSPGNELFPFIDQKGNLWYASNGIPGLGGLDIFRAEKHGEGFSGPVNVGYPVNTRFDDFGLITAGAGEEGYFSSDRNNHYGNDDIYSFKKYSRKPVLVYDAQSGKVLSFSRVDVREEGAVGAEIAGEVVLAAQYSFNPDKSYELTGMKEGYKPGKITLTKEEMQAIDTVKIPLTVAGPVISMTGYVFGAVDKAPRPGYSAMITTGSGAAGQGTESDAQGSFRGQLLPGRDYRVTVTGPGGKGKCMTDPVEFTTSGIAKDTTIRLMFPVYCEGDLIVMEDIYYDLDKYNIRPDAAKVLDKLLKLMNDYPGMKIELRSHTDSRASAGYNLSLSDKRAKSAVQYLYSKGIARNRVRGKGYGETMLLNNCSDGVPCSEAEHQRNRRTEFKIMEIGNDLPQEDSKETGYTRKRKSVTPAVVPDKRMEAQPTSPATASKTESVAEQQTGKSGTADCYLIIRSFKTKKFAEKYVRKTSKELDGIQVIGEIAPYRVGVRCNNYTEARDYKKKLVEKYPDCWILR